MRSFFCWKVKYFFKKLDGAYIPRIFFLDSTGQVLENVQNTKGNPDYKYFYHNAESVISSMRQVLENNQSNKEEL